MTNFLPACFGMFPLETVVPLPLPFLLNGEPSGAWVPPGVGKVSSSQLAGYFGSSRSRAAAVMKSGRKVSHITASSSVKVAPIAFSMVPGCGPCGMPWGWTEIDSISIPLRAL